MSDECDCHMWRACEDCYESNHPDSFIEIDGRVVCLGCAEEAQR